LLLTSFRSLLSIFIFSAWKRNLVAEGLEPNPGPLSSLSLGWKKLLDALQEELGAESFGKYAVILEKAKKDFDLDDSAELLARISEKKIEIKPTVVDIIKRLDLQLQGLVLFSIFILFECF
jgi:hypothetical protein